MRAVRVIGDSAELALVEEPDPVAGPDEVLIDVVAAGVNRADLLQAAGHYPPPPGASDILGLEVSGIVTEVGAGVGRWHLGDRVCALLTGGGYAERVAVPAHQVLPVPADLSLREAAALPEAACTVWSNLSSVVEVGPRDTVLIHGGASGIGTFAIQFVVAMGARAIVTAGSPRKLAVCEQLGAEGLIDYSTQDFVAEVADLTDGHGADIILDVVGAQYLQRNVSALADGGRLVVIGLQGGARAELNLGQLLARRGTITATALRSRSAADKERIVAAVETDIWPLVAAGSVRPVIDRFLPMAEAAEAHRVLGAGEHIGKVVLLASP